MPFFGYFCYSGTFFGLLKLFLLNIYLVGVLTGINDFSQENKNSGSAVIKEKTYMP